MKINDHVKLVHDNQRCANIALSKVLHLVIVKVTEFSFPEESMCHEPISCDALDQLNLLVQKNNIC